MGGTRVIDRVHLALAGVTGEIVLVANDPGASSWLPGVELRRDAHPGAGGLAGVHAALGDGADALAVAWDMPFVTTELLLAICDRAEPGADACVPESDSPHGIEPFCALYRQTVAAPLAAFLAAGGGPAREFLDRCRVRRMSLSDVRRFGDPAALFMNVNSPADLERARAMSKV